MSKVKVIAVDPILSGGERFAPGAGLELDESEADHLVKIGAVKWPEAKPSGRKSAPKAPAAGQAGGGDAAASGAAGEPADAHGDQVQTA